MTETAERRLRQFLLGLPAFIFVGTVIELLLETHTKEPLQLVPFVLCVIGFAAAILVLLRPRRSTILALRASMVIVSLGGLVGMGLHLLRNFEFEREVHSNAAAIDTIVGALTGASPLVAPGILVFAALVAISATYYHPALARQDVSQPEKVSGLPKLAD